MIVLVVVGDNKFYILLFELCKLGEEMWVVVLFGVIEKSFVYIGDDNFNGYKRVFLV